MYRVVFRADGALTPTAVFQSGMRGLFPAIAGTRLAFPLHNLELPIGERTAVVDVRTATGAELRTVAELVGALERLGLATRIGSIERLAGTSSPTERRETQVTANKQLEDTSLLAKLREAAARAERLVLVVAIAAAVLGIAYVAHNRR